MYTIQSIFRWKFLPTIEITHTYKNVVEVIDVDIAIELDIKEREFELQNARFQLEKEERGTRLRKETAERITIAAPPRYEEVLTNI